MRLFLIMMVFAITGCMGEEDIITYQDPAPKAFMGPTEEERNVYKDFAFCEQVKGKMGEFSYISCLQAMELPLKD